jgi:hypothetical protein
MFVVKRWACRNLLLNSCPRLLDNCPYQDTVREWLDIILQLFSDSHKIKNKYGWKDLAKPMQIEDGRSNTVRKLTAVVRKLQDPQFISRETAKYATEGAMGCSRSEKVPHSNSRSQRAYRWPQDITKGLSLMLVNKMR